MLSTLLYKKLIQQTISVDLGLLFEISKVDSGGDRDMHFLQYLLDNKLLIRREYSLNRPEPSISEVYYLDKYTKMRYETDRHFLCRTVLQDELSKINIPTLYSVDVGDMNILRVNSNYDIATEDISILIDLGLTPARNYFRGLSDLRVQAYLITNYFDDYTDNLIFSSFTRADDRNFIEALIDYEEGFKAYPVMTHSPLSETELPR